MTQMAYRVDVKMSIELIIQLLNRTDDSTWLILEGDLSQFRPAGMSGVVHQSANGQGNRVMIPLTRENVFWLKTAVLLRVGIRSLVRNVYLRKDDHELFASCDCFRYGAAIGDWISPDVISDLQRTGVIAVH